MANTIIHKNNSTTATPPLVGDLELGELAINTFDGKLFLKKNDGTPSIVEVGAKLADKGDLLGFDTADAILPVGADGFVLTADSAEATGLKWAAAGLASVSADPSPALGGALDVAGNAIVSTTAGNIAITPDTTGSIILDGLSWPQADAGAAGYVLKSDASAQLGWAEVSTLVVPANIIEPATAIATTGAVTLDASLGTYFYNTATTGPITFTFTNPATTGNVTAFTLELFGGATNAPVWPGSVVWSGGTPPTWSAGVDVIRFTTRDAGTTWIGVFA